MQKFGYAVVLAALLSACGGGGGSPGNTGANRATVSANDPTNAYAMTFAPATVGGTFIQGTSGLITVTGTIVKPADFAGADVYTYLVDEQGVILPDVKFTRATDTSEIRYSIVMRTSASLALGTYTGKFTIKLCRDSACNTHFPGSPLPLPYEIIITKA